MPGEIVDVVGPLEEPHGTRPQDPRRRRIDDELRQHAVQREVGDRRALAAKNYLLTLGVAGDRIKTVSYGKEFPFDPGHDESAFSQNRRAHFTITAKDE